MQLVNLWPSNDNLIEISRLLLLFLFFWMAPNKLQVRIPREDKRDKFLRQVPLIHYTATMEKFPRVIISIPRDPLEAICEASKKR